MREFLRFSYHFGNLFWKTRGVLVCLFLLIVLGGWIIFLLEPISFGQSVYLAFITAFTIGYGDLTPDTAWAQFTAVVIGYIGLVFMGLTVAVASLALKRAV